LVQATNHGEVRCGLDHPDGYRIDFVGYGFTAPPQLLLTFLRKYKWSEGKVSGALETEFLERAIVAGEVGNCTVLVPQARTGQTISLPRGPTTSLSVSKRARVSETRFGVYSDPKHRYAATFLAGVNSGTNPTDFLSTKRSSSSAVLLLYPVSEVLPCADEHVSIGFGIQFPGTKKVQAITWTVVDPSHRDDAVVSRERNGALGGFGARRGKTSAGTTAGKTTGMSRARTGRKTTR
jgi:hypothetical protein